MNSFEDDRRRTMPRLPPAFLRGLVILLVLGGGGFLVWASRGHVSPGSEWVTAPERSQGALETLEVYGPVPEFSLIERSGKRVTLSDLLGKVWVVDFFYTRCPDTCPLQSANMARLQAEFAEEADLRLVSVSVDPAYDTPRILSTYAKRYRADAGRWFFLTGSKDAVYRLAVDGFHLAAPEPDKKTRRGTEEGRMWIGPARTWAHSGPDHEMVRLIHSSRFVLVDREAHIRGYYDGTDWESVTRLRGNLKAILRDR
ncbi:MAG: SCO family protein [candidate division NC10 bacterium]|nr:SCO family protein [candidate division NC10 bacterium]